MPTPLNVTVTGAWGYSGGRIVERLRERGHRVTSLTTHGPVDGTLADGRTDPWEGAVAWARPVPQGRADWDSDHVRTLLERWETDVLVSTYWSRHAKRPVGHRGPWTGHTEALDNSLRLIAAAEGAGVRRLVWTSITNADGAVDLSYFSGKHRIEQRLAGSPDCGWAVLRPACFFGYGGPGPEPDRPGILLENVAWGCRVAPIFPVPEGDCPMRPIHVDDYARLVVREVENPDVASRSLRDACGPERYRLADLVTTVAEKLGVRSRPVALPAGLCLLAYGLFSRVCGETILTPDELEGLRQNLLDSAEEPAPHAGGEGGGTRLSEWVSRNSARLGRRMAREPAR